MNPKVSVIVPTFRRGENLLSRSINSLLNQTYDNIEIIIIDDNANLSDSKYRNKNEKIIKKYDNSKIVYIKNLLNMGGSESRNHGIKNASGDFVTFLDDDDLYLPEKISTQVKYMVDNKFEVSITNLKICNEHDKLIDYRSYANNLESLNQKDILEYHLTRHLTGTPTFMYKKDVIEKIGGFPNVKMGQEFHLMLNTINEGYKIGYLPLAEVIAYRHQEGGISSGNNKIVGELNLYKFKKKYFHSISTKCIKFIKFRHYIVLAYSYKRSGNLLKTLKYLCLSLVASPKDFFTEIIKLNKNVRQHNQIEK